VVVPILAREIPVIADGYVDRAFGTGALKITPGHDPNDYAIGERHNLGVISVLDEAARLNQNGGPYVGLDRFECRKKIWEDMRNAGLVIKEEPYMLNVPRTQRGGEIVEPMVSTQWFVRIQPLAEAALAAVRDGHIRIVPERFTKVYFNWLENIEDWCISRQLWWGHRIPVWHCQDCGEMTVTREDPVQCSGCSSGHLTQDPDVLDTWFSSGLWPFSTLGWPEKTPDLDYFYPTTMMETGYDIIFFWVARMIMLGLEFTGEVPFNTVYLHGLIRDEHGRKMSKSYGNVIDPLPVMDEMGTDALRFTLLVGSTPGNDMNLSLKRVEANRNFANKLWNAARLVIGSIPKAPKQPEQPPQWGLADAFIFGRLKQLIRDVDRLFQGYQYGEAGRQIYEFFWGDYADWYLEAAKLQVAEGGDRAFFTVDLMVRVLDTILRLLHPFTPFVTEEIYGHLKKAAESHSNQLLPQDKEWREALIISRWPEPILDEGWERENIANFQLIQEIVRSIRNLRSEKNVKPDRRIPAMFSASFDTAHLLMHEVPLIAGLAGLDVSQVKVIATTTGSFPRPEGHIPLVASGIEIFLPLSGLVDLEDERRRLKKALAEADAQINRLENLLASDFAKKAPEGVVQKEREKLKEYRETREKLLGQMEALI
jgi:valyl-tRNA synthetase